MTALTNRSGFILGLLLVALLCDGFDLQLVAFAAPRLAKEWGIAADALRYVQTANLLGMMFGSMVLGNLGDRVGRKRVIVIGTLIYSVMALLCLLARNPSQLGALRFLTGIGLGGVLPNVIALASEVSAGPNRARLTSIPIIGMSLGSGMPAVVAAWLVPIWGWRALFVVGGIVPIVVALVIARWLPESSQYLQHSEQQRAPRGRIADLFTEGLGLTTPLLWLMFACTLMSMHFLNSWISVILNQAGLSEVQTALTNGALHWGGAVAAVITVFVLGRMGLHWALLLLLSGLAGCFTIATTGFASTTLLTTAVCMAGFGIIGCQGVLNATAGLLYPVACRPTGVGAALGVGRIGSLSGPLIGGYVLAQHLPTQSMFYVPLLPLGIAAAATAVLILRGVNVRGEGIKAR
jgi:AAHS family 4-hydroxybenzoate transporter-like MFS transporter